MNRKWKAFQQVAERQLKFGWAVLNTNSFTLSAMHLHSSHIFESVVYQKIYYNTY